MRDRRVVGDAAVHQLAVLPRDGRQDAGIAALAMTASSERAAREQQLLACYDIDGDNVQRNRQLLKPLVPTCRRRAAAGPNRARGGHVDPRKPSRPLSGLRGKTWLRRTWRQMVASSSAVSTVCAREAMNAPLIAPAEVATIRSGAMSRS